MENISPTSSPLTEQPRQKLASRVLVVAVVVIAVALLVIVWFELDQKGAASDVNEADRQAIMDSLGAEPGPDLSEEERQRVLTEMEAEQEVGLSEAEKAKIMKSLEN